MARLIAVLLLSLLLLGGLLVAPALAPPISPETPAEALGGGSVEAPAAPDGGSVGAPVALPPLSTEEAIRRAELPWRDLAELAVRMKGVPPEAANAPEPVAPPQRRVGERATFWLADHPNDSYYTVEATLQVVTPNSYMYVADDARVDLAKLQQAAAVFDERIYTGTRAHFGEERPVGLDGDPRVTVLNGTIPGLGGYFTSADDYPRGVHPYSNERKALYINVAAAPPGSASYYSILAHELEHMIHWNTNRHEQTWVKEGAAEVATEAANLGSSGAVLSFETKPDTQLTGWAPSKGDVVPHYGAAYLFLSYFLERFGGYQVAADLLTGTTRGPETFDRFLLEKGHGSSFEEVFKDWVVANHLDGTAVQDPRYGYQKLRVRVPATERVTASTDWRDRTVRQFAADYLELSGRWDGAMIQFDGDHTTRVVPARARSGRHFWWSNRGDLVDTRLTRAFDLRGLSGATLRFWSWYDLEDDYDYVYVAASRDGGATWSTLEATTTRTEDPNGNNLGHGFTARSAGSAEGRWVEEIVDLGAYAGEEILLRFEHVADDAYNAPGFAVDDISVPELGYSTDAEDEGGWLAEGFVRVDGELPQPFALQLIRFGNEITVEEVVLSPTQEAEVVLAGTRDRSERVVLVISGLSRYTSEPARYRYRVAMAP